MAVEEEEEEELWEAVLGWGVEEDGRFGGCEGGSGNGRNR